jgi:hypothetical protein
MYWTVKFNTDPNESLETEEREQQFLIKWKGWSHINNTWESEKSIGRPIRKLVYYCSPFLEDTGTLLYVKSKMHTVTYWWSVFIDISIIK